MSANSKQGGFTFIEVMVAMLIFVMAVVAAIGIVRGAVRATQEAKEISVATWLLQSKMVEIETALEAKGIDRACEKKKEGKFDAPYENFSWIAECYEVDMQLNATQKQLQDALSGGDSNKQEQGENPVQKLIFNVVNEYIGKVLREIHVEVAWKQGKNPKKISVTSHFARYDQPLALPAIPGLAAPPTAPVPGGTGG